MYLHNIWSEKQNKRWQLKQNKSILYGQIKQLTERMIEILLAYSRSASHAMMSITRMTKGRHLDILEADGRFVVAAKERNWKP